MNSIKLQVAALSGKVDKIFDNARRENRPLSEKERGLISEIREFFVENCATEEVRALDRLCSEPVIGPITGPRPANQSPGPIAHRQIGGGTTLNGLGEQLKAVVEAGRPGGWVDPRLYNAATGLGETVHSEGGFLLNSDFSTALLGGLFDQGNLPGMCNRFEIGGDANSIKLPAIDETSRASTRWGGVLGYWLDEAAEKTASKPKFRQLELSLKKIAVLIYATDELLQDSGVLAKVIAQAAQDELSFRLNDAIVRGTGAGQPLGILNSGATITASKQAGQVQKTFTYENALSMWSRLLPRAKQNSAWLVNTDVEPQLYSMSLAVGTGGIPVYMPAGGASGAPYASLFGRPVIPHESCSTLGTAGDVILGDFSDGYILATKGGIESAMSIHVRITPAQGSTTQSHFVILETRS